MDWDTAIASNDRTNALDGKNLENLTISKLPPMDLFSRGALRYILFSDLKEHGNGICKFGEDYKILFKIAKECGC